MEQKSLFTDYATVLVRGSSSIDHARRVALNMGLLHYVVMSYCLKMEKDAKPIREINLWVDLGIKSRQFQKAAAWLIANGYLTCCELDRVPASTGRHRMASGSKSVDDLFEEFWKPMTVGGRTCRFVGSKDAAKKLYKYAVDDVGHDYLMEQRLWYFRLLSENPDRNAMMGATFLAKGSRRYTEDFKVQCRKLYQVLPDKPIKVASAKEIKNLFEEED